MNESVILRTSKCFLSVYILYLYHLSVINVYHVVCSICCYHLSHLCISSICLLFIICLSSHLSNYPGSSDFSVWTEKDSHLRERARDKERCRAYIDHISGCSWKVCGKERVCRDFLEKPDPKAGYWHSGMVWKGILKTQRLESGH